MQFDNIASWYTILVLDIPDGSSYIYIAAKPCTLLQILFTVALLTAAHCLSLYELWTNLRASALFSIIASISSKDLRLLFSPS